MDFIPFVQPLAILFQLRNGIVTQGTIHEAPIPTIQNICRPNSITVINPHLLEYWIMAVHTPLFSKILPSGLPVGANPEQPLLAKAYKPKADGKNEGKLGTYK